MLHRISLKLGIVHGIVGRLACRQRVLSVASAVCRDAAAERVGPLVSHVFNFGKCKCLHAGSGNTGMNYEMGGTILSKTVK